MEIDEKVEKQEEIVEKVEEVVETKDVETEIEKEKQEEIKEEQPEEEKKDTEKVIFEATTEKNKKNKVFIFSVIGGIIIFLLLFFSTIFALININNSKIIKGISINGIDVSGLSIEEATDKINSMVADKVEGEILLKYKEYQETIDKKQIELKYDTSETVNKAYQIGRDNNVFINNFNIIKTKISKTDIKINIEYNEEELDKKIEGINANLPGAVKESSYYIEENELIVLKGKEGILINSEELKQNILNNLNDLETNNNEIQITTETKKPEEIDIKKIHEEVYTEVKDAYYTTNPFKLYPHVNGVDFNITIEEAEELLKEDKEEYIIPLKIVKPKITTDQIGSEAFPDLLGTFNTKYDAGNTSRSTNLILAAGKINGTVIMPGDTFSYNKVVGERTIAAGYKEAKIYSSGQVIDGLGGGICQISSTLYNSVVYANLEIVSRRNHQFLTSYVGAGRDATVVYGATDFKFKNTRNYPIRIKASVKNGIAKVDIYGIKEEEYVVEIKSTVTSQIPFGIQYIEDGSLASGKEIVEQKGNNGCRSETYKIVSLNGKVIERTLLSKDTYTAMQKIIRRGSKFIAPEVIPDPIIETPPVVPDIPAPDVDPVTPDPVTP